MGKWGGNSANAQPSVCSPLRTRYDGREAPEISVNIRRVDATRRPRRRGDLAKIGPLILAARLAAVALLSMTERDVVATSDIPSLYIHIASITKVAMK
jgi:hypothetical protein